MEFVVHLYLKTTVLYVVMIVIIGSMCAVPGYPVEIMIDYHRTLKHGFAIVVA